MSTRRDNVEFHTGAAAFHAGKQQSENPYLNTAETRACADSRWNRWDLGYREACEQFMFPTCKVDDVVDFVNLELTKADVVVVKIGEATWRVMA